MELAIEYLLFLQGLREIAPEWINSVLEFISEISVGPLPYIIPALIFWCWSKKDGMFLVASQGFSNVVNGIVKNTFCIYRPWIIDDRVQSSLMTTATGYSFPSGHSMIAGSFYGGIGKVHAEHTGKKRYFWLWLIPALVTGFARNWVGAHTPQDVVVGLILSVIITLLTYKLFQWLDEHPDKDVMVTIICLVICALAVAYILLKSYPLDYNADGSVVVDPSSMTRDIFGNVGMMSGMMSAWIIERRCVKLDVEGTSKQTKITRAVIGCILYALFYAWLTPWMKEVITQPHACKFVVAFLQEIWLLLLCPILFKVIDGKKAE